MRRDRVFISGETLARAVTIGDEIAEGDFPHMREVDIDGTPVWIGLRPSGA